MPQATDDTTTPTINKATTGHVASELDFIKTGFEILMEYTFEGGPDRHKQWLVDVLIDRVRDACDPAWELEAATIAAQRPS